MKILYGVQGTGNGHVSRANAMAEALGAWPEVEVTWLLSGREKARGCGDIDDFQWRKGVTFVIREGRVLPLATLRQVDLRRFLRDVRELAPLLDAYDMVISDYEPVISHAARRRGIPVIGIGHQYAFRHPVPTRGDNPVLKGLMQWYAPATVPVGLHWHHFGFPILPPIVDLHVPDPPPAVRDNKVVVYLPFETPQAIFEMIRGLRDHEFHVYHPELNDRTAGNVHCAAISRGAFKRDLLEARHVICNSGFELISECLQTGKRILAKPVHGQMEQLSNARALEELGYATVMDRLDGKAIAEWLARNEEAPTVRYPNVAEALAEWIAGGCREGVPAMAERLWRQVGTSEEPRDGTAVQR